MAKRKCRPTITVTKKDIADGITAVNSCPIALAVKRRFGIKEARDVSVDPDYIRIGSCDYDTPARAAKFINSFDNENGRADESENSDRLQRKTPYGWAAKKHRVKPFKFKLPLAIDDEND